MVILDVQKVYMNIYPNLIQLNSSSCFIQNARVWFMNFKTYIYICIKNTLYLEIGAILI